MPLIGLIDHSLDALNPRTEGRHLPSGRLQRIDLWIFAICCILLLIVSTCMLNWLCVALLPVALAMVLCLFLHQTIYLALPLFPRCHGCHCPYGNVVGPEWSVQAQLLYRLLLQLPPGLQDLTLSMPPKTLVFDREQGLHSIPARFGARKALVIASFSHLVSFLLLVIWGSFYQVGYWYYLGCLVVGSLLFVENALVAPGKLKHVTTAAYHINEIVSVLFFVFIALEVYLP